MNTLLMGKTEEIDPVMPGVRRMIENEGIYACGDTRNSKFTIPVVSIGGKLFSIKLDAELPPEHFTATVTIAGPLRKAEVA